ncbi:Alpha/Beta hydrolase protein [Helicostylum pulchrum]|nr:Alpha/Beta hydrolase protein [Helicostylum pulchrum]
MGFQRSLLSKIMSQVKLFHNSDPVKIQLRNEGNRSVSLTDYVAEKCPSLVGPKAVYHPTSYLFNGHLQTGYAAYHNYSPTVHEVIYERELVDTPDGGIFSLDWTPTKEGLENDQTPTLVVLHGLTGGSDESYIRCILEIVTYPPFNYRAVVMNSRGCANTDILTPHIYSGGYTNDLRTALKHIQNRLAPGTPLVGIGFSLGSNVLVKYLGEEGDKTPFKAAISVANPFDFRSSMDRLDESFIGKNVYSVAMANNLKKAFGKHLDTLAKGGKINPDEIMSSKTMRQFDDACTRKMFDFTTVNNYYRDASSCRFIEHVKVPLLCLNALDDPIAHGICIPYDEIKTNRNIVLATTKYGGHIGWFEHNAYPTRWMAKPLTEFIVAMFQAFDVRENQGDKLEPATIDDTIDQIQNHLSHGKTA